MNTYGSFAEFFFDSNPTYKGRHWHPLLVKFDWDPDVVDFVEELSPRRCASRRETYIIPGELERSTQFQTKRGSSLRFGNIKTGKGYKGKRLDFCLVGGRLRAGTLLFSTDALR